MLHRQEAITPRQTRHSTVTLCAPSLPQICCHRDDVPGGTTNIQFKAAWSVSAQTGGHFWAPEASLITALQRSSTTSSSGPTAQRPLVSSSWKAHL